jgi:lambda family phage portal protein
MAYSALASKGFILPARLKNSYDGAGQGRRAANWQPGGNGPVSTGSAGLQTLRNRSRAAVRNDPYAATALDKLGSNHIGTGIVPMPKHSDATIRRELQDLWGDWCEESDADGQLDFYGQQLLVARSMFESGECFVRLRPRSLKEDLAVPLQIQILEPEFVPHDKNGKAPNGNNIRQGIEFNQTGKRVAYWMYRNHPGERGQCAYNDLIRVEASQILHIFEPTRPGQLRGVPHLAPVLLRMKTLDEFDDAVLFRQEVANLFAGFISKPNPENSMFPGMQATETQGFSMVGLEPGTMQELEPGEEVAFSKPPDAGNNYDEFMRQQLAAVAAGIGLPYELLSGDLRNISDRVMRVILNEFRRRVEQRQHGIFVHQLCRPIRKAWMDMAVLSGAIVLPGYAKNPRVYRRTNWVPQGWPYLHPVQDVQADQKLVRAGFTSRSAVILKRGEDPETIDREIEEDNARADRMNLHFDSDARLVEAPDGSLKENDEDEK